MAAIGAALAALVVTTGATSKALDTRASYPEGPLYVGETLYYAEMGADRVSTIEKGRKRVFWSEPDCGPTALAPYGEGLLVFCHIGERFALVDRAGRTVRHFGREPDEVFPARPVGHPNDGIADDKGGVYFSDPGPFSKDAPAQGAVKRLGPDGVVTTVASDLWYPNGIWFDAGARALFVDEHLARRVLRFDVAADGTLSNKTVFAEIDAIAPPSTAPFFREAGVDGLERAPNGDLVVAIYGESRLLQLTPEGKLRRVIPTPFQYVTNIAFAPDGSAAVVGSFINDQPPFPGQVIRLPPEAFAIPR
ncbi:MAG: SMP-30/gluconolactonase/LRE family protein [Alphaproteobacteria bacterium]|nr:SMP-30/gluconolactonase/LRE family protein [Alphaproteobacteria bacterium]